MNPRRPVQSVRFWEIQHRPSKSRPWVVRWVIDGQPHSRSWPTKAQAQRYRSRLMVAHDDGERFDTRTGEPASWAPQGEQTSVYDWARTWLAEQWDELAPRSRESYAKAIARFVALAVATDASDPPAGMYRHLQDTLAPRAIIDPGDDRERWLRRWGLTLGELNRELLANVDRKLGLGVQGQRLAASTAARFRKHAKACVRRAAELGKIPSDPWPPATRGRSRRKANRVSLEVDIRRLPDPEQMAEVLSCLPSKRQGRAGRTWEVMSAISYYAGLRPSETKVLRRRAVHLPHMPAGGWGFIEVTEADDGEGNVAATKTSTPRRVPSPPTLTQLLWDFGLERPGRPEEPLFLTRNGTRPDLNNWGRALARACGRAGVPRLTPYDLRHACATTWLQAGVSLGTAARRLGHSVQVLVAHYIQALTGDESAANACIEAVLGNPAPRPSREHSHIPAKQTSQTTTTGFAA